MKTSGINPYLRSAVDQDLYLKILEHGDASFINEVLYYYRIHSKGISQQKSKQHAKDSFARAIYDTMIRRNLKNINDEKIPFMYKNSEEIYSLLKYQLSFLYRLKIKIKLFLKKVSNRLVN